MTQRMRVSAFSPETSNSSGTETPKYKHGHRIHPRRARENIYDETETSETEFPQQNVYEDEDEDEQYTDNGTQYTESETVTNTPRNRFSSLESGFETESIHESNTNEVAASLNSTSYSPNLLQTAAATTTAYVNIAPLPIFRGGADECPITHLSRFTKVCRANNASSIEMMMRIFPVTLDNDAALWYDLNIEPYPSLNWEEIKSSFMQVYRRTEFVDQFRSELMMMKQGESESVHAFFLRMQWILKRWPDHGIPNEVLKGIFVDGLREDFQDWIDPQKPNSLNDALQLALAWEQAKSIRAARNKKNMKCGFCDGSHEEKACEIRERMRELWMKDKEKLLKASSLECEKEATTNKEFVRLASTATSSSILGREGEKEEGELSWKKKSQCQCWKHQCWKKKIERTNSMVTRNSKAD